MTRPRVATVLSAREWEPAFAVLARATGVVRLVTRAYEPSDLENDELDVIVAGAETAWVTPTVIKTWRRRGMGVLGLHPPYDRPAARLLRAGGADEILPDSTAPDRVLHVARTLARPTPIPTGQAHLTAVTGPRGAPGISEVALALAWGLAEEQSTLLIDLDSNAPSLSLRLGVAPFPDLAEAADAVLLSGDLPPGGIRRVGPVSFLTVPPVHGPLAPLMIQEVLRAASHTFTRIVMDLGPIDPDDPLLAKADTRVLACDASPKGLVRAALLTRNWTQPAPALVLNRAPEGSESDVLTAARRWLGLEPAVVLPEMEEVREAARCARPPLGPFVEMLRPLHRPEPLR